MEIDVNSVVLSARIYAALRARFFIADAPGATVDADGGGVIATIRGTILEYVDESISANLK
jgi:hypothetical protein